MQLVSFLKFGEAIWCKPMKISSKTKIKKVHHHLYLGGLQPFYTKKLEFIL